MERELGDSTVVGPGISQSQTQFLPRLYQLENLVQNQPCENDTPFNIRDFFQIQAEWDSSFSVTYNNC